MCAGDARFRDLGPMAPVGQASVPRRSAQLWGLTSLRHLLESDAEGLLGGGGWRPVLDEAGNLRRGPRTNGPSAVVPGPDPDGCAIQPPSVCLHFAVARAAAKEGDWAADLQIGRASRFCCLFWGCIRVCRTPSGRHSRGPDCNPARLCARFAPCPPEVRHFLSHIHIDRPDLAAGQSGCRRHFPRLSAA